MRITLKVQHNECSIINDTDKKKVRMRANVTRKKRAGRQRARPMHKKTATHKTPALTMCDGLVTFLFPLESLFKIL